jgi:hypothetical protein
MTCCSWRAGRRRGAAAAIAGAIAGAVAIGAPLDRLDGIRRHHYASALNTPRSSRPVSTSASAGVRLIYLDFIDRDPLTLTTTGRRSSSRWRSAGAGARAGRGRHAVCGLCRPDRRRIRRAASGCPFVVSVLIPREWRRRTFPGGAGLRGPLRRAIASSQWPLTSDGRLVDSPDPLHGVVTSAHHFPSKSPARRPPHVSAA